MNFFCISLATEESKLTSYDSHIALGVEFPIVKGKTVLNEIFCKILKQEIRHQSNRKIYSVSKTSKGLKVCIKRRAY